MSNPQTNQDNPNEVAEFLEEVIDLMEENNIEFPKSNPSK